MDQQIPRLVDGETVAPGTISCRYQERQSGRQEMHLRPRIFVAGVAVLLGSSAMGADGADTLSLGLGKIFTFFFLTLGPNSIIAPFARATASSTVADRRKVALITTGISLLAVLIAATIGIRVLGNWGVSTGALLVAAGIIFFLVAIESIRSQYRIPEKAHDDTGGDLPWHLLAYKLAFPCITGLGARRTAGGARRPGRAGRAQDGRRHQRNELGTGGARRSQRPGCSARTGTSGLLRSRRRGPAPRPPAGCPP